MICTFQTGYAGVCGRTAEYNKDRCKRHEGKKDKVKLVKIGKYSGASKWRKELGFAK